MPEQAQCVLLNMVLTWMVLLAACPSIFTIFYHLSINIKTVFSFLFMMLMRTTSTIHCMYVSRSVEPIFSSLLFFFSSLSLNTGAKWHCFKRLDIDYSKDRTKQEQANMSLRYICKLDQLNLQSQAYL